MNPTNINIGHDEISDQIQRLAQVLSTRRISQGLRQRDVEETCKLPQATISRIERGTFTTIVTLLKYANALGLTLNLIPLDTYHLFITEEAFPDDKIPDGASRRLLALKANELVQRYITYYDHALDDLPSPREYANLLLENPADFEFYMRFPDSATPLVTVLNELGLSDRRDYINAVYLKFIPVNSSRICAFLNWKMKRLMDEQGMDQESAVEQIRKMWYSKSQELAWCEAPQRPTC